MREGCVWCECEKRMVSMHRGQQVSIHSAVQHKRSSSGPAVLHCRGVKMMLKRLQLALPFTCLTQSLLQVRSTPCLDTVQRCNTPARTSLQPTSNATTMRPDALFAMSPHGGPAACVPPHLCCHQPLPPLPAQLLVLISQQLDLVQQRLASLGVLRHRQQQQQLQRGQQDGWGHVCVSRAGPCFPAKRGGCSGPESVH